MPQGLSHKRIGQRDKYVTLHEGVAVTDPLGGRSQIWPQYGDAWAAIHGEALVVSEAQSFVSYMVSFPYRADTVDKHRSGTQQRVVGGGLTLKVLEVVDAEQRHRQLTLHCADAGTGA